MGPTIMHFFYGYAKTIHPGYNQCIKASLDARSVQLATVLYENKSLMLAVCLAFIPSIQVCKSEFLFSALNFPCQLTPKP